ncbi:hypothetical protein AAEU28_15585 [Pseudoalteromonas sp. SS15]|uniref:hypothetical protein n=1 Tax=Pseudoalteromonas sp. SS15 TaxID=3139393 RepID=UPI003BADBC8F
MNKLLLDNFLQEFETAIEEFPELESQIDINAFKGAISNYSFENESQLTACIELIMLLVKEMKVKNTRHLRSTEILTSEEKYFLRSINS